MAHIIKYSEKKKGFKIGEEVAWNVISNDGRSSFKTDYKGTLVKVNKVTLDIRDFETSNIWRVAKTEIN